jgi:hypothetical protein
MEGPKKRVNKYGKAGRRTLVHDLFDVTAQPNVLYTTVQESPIESLVPSRGATPSSQASEDKEISRQLNDEMLTTWNAEKSRLKSPIRKTTAMRPVAPSSMFEIESSEEDKPAKKQPPKTYKRRRITPTGSDAEALDQRGRSREPMTAGDPNIHAREIVRGVAGRAGGRKAKSSISNESKFRTRRTKLRSEVASTRESPKRDTTTKPLNVSAPSTPPRRPSSDIGSPVSDISVASMVSTRSAAKRKREALNGPASDVSSPSQLELSSLRLTPQRTTRPRSRSGERSTEDFPAANPPKVRKRLIDRLEAASPQTAERSTQHPIEDAGIAATTLSSSRRSRPPTSVPESMTNSQPEARQDSSQSQKGTVKPRKYGKQRSHLRDLGNGSSQESGSQSLEDLVSQVDALSNSQQSQFDIEMSDGEDDAVHLKSIHELRQAGAVNRFDRDLDSVIEDIGSDTKALRVSGLMQLVRKLKEQSFKRHILDHGKVARLTGLIRADMDLISASVMLLALWTLAHSESATGHLMLQLYEGILRLPAGLLQEGRALSKIANDREQNLSKALIRDLTDFESHVLDQSASSGRQTSQIVVSRIAVRAIEVLLRRVIASGEIIAPTPRAWLEAAIACIQNRLRIVRDSGHMAAPEHVETIRLLLAWLELSEGSRGSLGQQLSDDTSAHFARLLAEVLSWAREANVAIEHSCLKLAIEMSNQNSSMAQCLASVDFATSAFAIIEEHFPKLADKAVRGLFKGDNDAASDKLSSVILALGSLLDLVDSAEEVRIEMTDDREGKGSQVDQFVKMFRLYVDETDEVSAFSRPVYGI